MKWEYKKRWLAPWTQNGMIDELNSQGRDGWELVAVLPVGGHVDALWAIYKRPLP